jgi:flagellar M-ring protein FliF
MQKTIQTLDGVDSARIHISMGESGAFADQQRKAAATVVLHLKQGGTLAPDQVNGVVHIVTQGVPDLDKNNVSVVDGSGRVLYDGTTQNGGTGLYDEKRKEEMAYSSNLRGQLERHFDQVLGPGKALVSVETTMNFDSIESDKNINTPAVDATNKAPTNDTNKVSETTSKTTYANGAGGIKGTAGTPSNLTGGGTGSTGSTTPNGREYSEDKKTAEYAFNREHLRTITTPGKVEALNVAVLLDDSLKQPQVQAITDYVNGLVGISPSTPKPGYAVTVSKLPFDQEQAKQAKAAGDKEKSSQMMDRIFGLAPSIALILAAILVMRALGKQSIKVQSPVLPEGLMPLALGPGVESMPTAGEGAIARVPSAQIDSGPNIVYTDSHEARIVTMIPQKFDLAFEQISVMAKEKPETIAVLLKSWMMEDKH